MNICADCRNPVNTCSWEKSFIPVPGWTATETKILVYSPGGLNKRTYTQSFDVTACPLFVPPPGYKPSKVRNSKPRRIIATNVATGEEVIYPSVRQAVTKGGFVDRSVHKVLSGQMFSHYGYKFRYTEEDDT